MVYLTIKIFKVINVSLDSTNLFEIHYELKNISYCDDILVLKVGRQTYYGYFILCLELEIT
jgi:hypothetical protein